MGLPIWTCNSDIFFSLLLTPGPYLIPAWPLSDLYLTSVGQLLISVDYMMKALWHGAYFPKEKRTKFNDKWREHFQVSKQNGKPEKEKSFLSDFLSHGTVLYSWIAFVKQSLPVFLSQSISPSLSLPVSISSSFSFSFSFILSLVIFLCLSPSCSLSLSLS